MRLSIQIPVDDLGAVLPAQAMLQGAADMPFPSAEYGLRHPLGIYSVSANGLRDAFQIALRAYQSMQEAHALKASTDAASANLTISMDRLLDAVAEHFNDARSVLRVVYDELGDKACGKRLRCFDETVRIARNFAAIQTNEIRHRQSLIRLIQVDHPRGRTLGYFIEGVDDSGAIGPNPRVHRGRTAFSFARAFRTLFAGVYHLSRALGSALHDGIKTRPVRDGFGSLLPIAEGLFTFSREVFWDEPEYMVELSLSKKFARLEFPSCQNWDIPMGSGQVTSIIGGDGVSRVFTIPYMGNYMRDAGKKGKKLKSIN